MGGWFWGCMAVHMLGPATDGGAGGADRARWPPKHGHAGEVAHTLLLPAAGVADVCAAKNNSRGMSRHSVGSMART